jgi:hypothetical protein
LPFFAPFAATGSLGSVFVVAIRFLGPASFRFLRTPLGFRGAGRTCWIVNGNDWLEKDGKFVAEVGGQTTRPLSSPTAAGVPFT